MRAAKGLKAIVGYHLLLTALCGAISALVVCVAVYRDEPEALSTAGPMAGIGGVLFLLALGLHLRLPAARWLEIVLLPLAGVLLTGALVWEAIGGDGRPKGFLVLILYWAKVVFALRLLFQRDTRELFAEGERPPMKELLVQAWDSFKAILAFILFAGLVVGLVFLRFQLVPDAEDSVLGLLGTIGGAFLTAGVLFAAGALLLGRREERERDVTDVAPETKARILALRAEDHSLRDIVRALADEGLPPPHADAWTPSMVKEVIKTEPLREAG